MDYLEKRNPEQGEYNMAMIKTGVVEKAKAHKIETDEELEAFEKKSSNVRRRLEKHAKNRIDKAKVN